MAQITYIISDDKLAEFKSGFLKHCPVPTNRNGVPIMTENAWIKEWGKQKFIWAYKKGKHLFALEQSEIEKDLIQ